MKKGVVIFGLFLCVVILSFSFVSAAAVVNPFKPIIDMVSGLISGSYEALKPALELLLGSNDGAITGDIGAEDIFFAKILLLIIFFGMVYGILSFSGMDFLTAKPWVLWLISIGVSILGVRFLDAELVSTIILPYSVLGVAITAGLPFVVYFIFVERGMQNTGRLARRTAWIFFAVIFLAIYSIRYPELPTYSYIYLLTAILAAFMAAFDGTIQRFWYKLGMERMSNIHNQELILNLRRKVHQADEDFANGLINQAVYTRMLKRYNDQIRILQRR